ncbi:MAG: thioredoxin fold domain-containing protein [Candidatus Thiodiazotropha endolucinida]
MAEIPHKALFLRRIREVVATGLLAILLPTGATTHSLPLHDAVQSEDVTILKRIITAEGSLDAQDQNGWTALMFAIEIGDTDKISVLLAAGASPNIGDRLGRTPLHLAMEKPVGITRLLIQAGADVDTRNAGGVTALMQAAGLGRRDIVELLLEAQARLDLKDYQGNSVVDWSQRSNHRKLRRMLERNLATQVKAEPKTSGTEFAEEVFVDVQFPHWFKTTFLELDEELKEAVGKGKQGLMVFVSTRHCSYCKAFIQNVLSLPDIRQRVERFFNVVGLEIFDDSEMTDPAGRSFRVKEFVSANKTAYTPSMIFYGANGAQQLKIVGYYPPEKFREVLEYLEGSHYLREPLRDYLVKTANTSSETTGRIISDPVLFSKPPYQLDRHTRVAEQPLLVLFERPNCGACERFHRRVLADQSIRRLMHEFETVQLDASDSTTRLINPKGERTTPSEWYARLDLAYSPSMVFFDDTGREVLRLDSETQRFRMEGTLQLVLEKGYEKDAQLQRWRRDKAVQLFNLEKH